LFQRQDLARLSADPTAAKAIDEYYTLPTNFTGKSRTSTVSRSMRPDRIDRGRVKRSHSQPDNLKFATKLVGKRVLDSQNHSVGAVSDLLVDLTDQRPTLAIIAGSSEHLAVRFDSLSIRPGGVLRLETASERILGNSVLNDSAWQSLATSSTTSVYRYPPTKSGHLRQGEASEPSDNQTKLPANATETADSNTSAPLK
jgi:hypothetical protein